MYSEARKSGDTSSTATLARSSAAWIISCHPFRAGCDVAVTPDLDAMVALQPAQMAEQRIEPELVVLVRVADEHALSRRTVAPDLTDAAQKRVEPPWSDRLM